MQTDNTHSCHHPRTHKIPVREIQRNPSALHNTCLRREEEKKCWKVKDLKSVDYCWNVEDNSNQFSDRVFKSNESWSLPHFDEIKNLHWREDYNPKYVEVSFSHTCNFKCSYCGLIFNNLAARS